MNDKDFSARWLPALPLVFFIALLLGMENVYGRYFPNVMGLLGHDFALAHPALLDGAYWFWKNGWLAVPWFSPAFCGGQPFFADVQSVYYSPLQWLAFFMPPTAASNVSLLLSCGLGYWSFYFLVRKVFGVSMAAGIAAGALAMLNGFLPQRYLLGEMGYQLFLLVAFVAHALLDARAWLPCRRLSLGNIFWAGLAIALMLQGGLTTLMIPAALGVLLLAFVARLRRCGTPLPVFFARGVGACLFALAICAAKLVAGATFMSHFHRDAYALPGFASLVDALVFPLLSLVFDSQTVWGWAMPRLVNVQWTIFPHEWAYNFGVSGLLLLLAGGVCQWRLRGSAGVPEAAAAAARGSVITAIFYLVGIVLLLLLPSALLWYSPGWNAVLKTVPIINTTSFPFRWIIIWIPLLAVCGAFAWAAVERAVPDEKAVRMLLLLFCLAMLLESALVNRDYYVTPQIQHYNPAIVDDAWRAGRAGNIPVVTELTLDGSAQQGQARNDSIVAGASFLACYNPAYGYRLETLPRGRLQPGPVLLTQDGFFNMKNPACLVWPQQNRCDVVGDEYRVTEAEQLQHFVRRDPVDFQVSPLQSVANTVTQVSLWMVLVGLLLTPVLAIRSRRV